MLPLIGDLVIDSGPLKFGFGLVLDVDETIMNEDFVRVAWLKSGIGMWMAGDGCMWCPAEQISIVSKGHGYESR
jgi:hypothetical protein